MIGADGLAKVFAELCRQAPPIPKLLAGILHSLQHASVADDVTLVALRRLAPEKGIA